MTNTDEETGIVQADIAEFEDNTQTPDRIEQITADGKLTTNTQVSFSQDPLRKVQDAIVQNITITGRSELAKEAEKLGGLLPKLLSLSFHYENDKALLTYSFPQNISVNDALYAINAQYGELTDYLLETDLFVNMGLKKGSSDLIPIQYFQHIPELQFFFSNITNGIFNLTLNPYLYVLIKPSEVRSFLAGVIDLAEPELYNNKNFSETTKTMLNISQLYQKISLRHIAQYGKNKGITQIEKYLYHIKDLANGTY